MYCQCRVTGNYEVVGLCNLSKFNCIDYQAAWTQINIPQVLMLPEAKPDIEAINKIYNRVEITSTDIIKTPCSDTANAEGLLLTGRKLLVEGYVCQTVVYTADVPDQSVHPVNFKIPFCSYIIIEGDADIELDVYCVVPCIEDVYSELLNKRMLFMDVTLFLMAKKVNNGC